MSICKPMILLDHAKSHRLARNLLIDRQETGDTLQQLSALSLKLELLARQADWSHFPLSSPRRLASCSQPAKVPAAPVSDPNI